MMLVFPILWTLYFPIVAVSLSLIAERVRRSLRRASVRQLKLVHVIANTTHRQYYSSRTLSHRDEITGTSAGLVDAAIRST
jgi:hypothetical protein